jgi:GNAT superfamily N-acetyltransferase
MSRYRSPYSGFYELNPFPGCNQLVVSNHAFVEPSDRGKGIGHSAHKDRLDHIKDLGYDAVVCTCVETNFIQVQILNKAGWHRVFRFYNRETMNWVGLWVRGIEQEGGQSKLECSKEGE